MGLRKFEKQEIFNFIVDYKRSHDGISPTMREIAGKFGIKSASTTVSILNGLAADGKIVLRKDIGARGIEVVGGKWDYVETI